MFFTDFIWDIMDVILKPLKVVKCRRFVIKVECVALALFLVEYDFQIIFAFYHYRKRTIVRFKLF